MKQVTVILIGILILFASCTVSREQIGNYKSIECKTEVYKKSTDVYLFWDIIPLSRTEKKLTIKNYEKVVKRSFFDMVIYCGTAGIFSFYTVKINVKKCDEEKNSH